MVKQKQLKLGALLHGVGGSVSGWRHPEAAPESGVDFWRFKEWVRKAEAGKLDLIFITDVLYITEQSIPQYLNQLEPVALLSALASVSENIGLVGTVSTSYSEPYTIARQLGTIDIISDGRAGWNIVTSALEGSAFNYSKTEKDHFDHDTRYRMAEEHLEVVRGLWDSWEDDAFIRNRETGEFFRPDKLHPLNYKGEFFSVQGPLNLSRSRQGQPVIFQAGSSEAGKDFSSRQADAIFTTQRTIEDGIAFTKEIRRRVSSSSRRADEVLVFNGIGPIIGRTEEEAELKYEQVANLVTIEKALEYLGLYFEHHDFTQYPLDEPFPDLGELGVNSFQRNTNKIKKDAKANQWTLRQVALRVATPRDPFVGTANQIADRMQEWLDTDAADGFLLLETVPNGLADFIDQVVPILQERGLFRTEYESSTLRGNLGLPIPQNRYAKI
jgi:FMN-dependent oxidoreductase (nitrilotriacetate monooxygenase family)